MASSVTVAILLQYSCYSSIRLALRSATAAAARKQTSATVDLLLQHRADAAPIEALSEAAQNDIDGARVMNLLLSRRDEERPVISLVVEMAATNNNYALDILEAILQHDGDIAVNDWVMLAAATNSLQGIFMRFLVTLKGPHLPITETIVEVIQEKLLDESEPMKTMHDLLVRYRKSVEEGQEGDGWVDAFFENVDPYYFDPSNFAPTDCGAKSVWEMQDKDSRFLLRTLIISIKFSFVKQDCTRHLSHSTSYCTGVNRPNYSLTTSTRTQQPVLTTNPTFP